MGFTPKLFQLEHEIFWEAIQNALCRLIGINKRLGSWVDVTVKVKSPTNMARSMPGLGRGERAVTRC